MTRITLVLIGILGLAACETVQGAGQDIENAGESVSNTSREVQSDM